MFVDYTDFNLLLIIEMTDNEQLDETEGKELSGYAKQRAKFKEELEAKDATIAQLREEIKANKVAYFKNTLTSNGYKGDFDEFANKYADNLDVNEMLSLYVGMNGGATAEQAVQQTTPEAPATEPQQQTI